MKSKLMLAVAYGLLLATVFGQYRTIAMQHDAIDTYMKYTEKSDHFLQKLATFAAYARPGDLLVMEPGLDGQSGEFSVVNRHELCSGKGI